MERRRWLRVNWPLAGLTGLVVFAGIILAVWRLPSWLYGDVTQASPDARLQAANGFRTALVAGLAGLAAVGSLAIATRTYRLTQQGQITDRYTKAIEQLGSDKQDVRLGGIYALERIANDSPPDRATIEEVLTAFVRGHAPWPPRSPGQSDKDTALADLQPLRSWAPDVQAAPTVLGRRKPPIGEIARLDLSDTDLRGANLYGADLQRTDLERARLQRASLVDIQVEEAFLMDAQLQEADLEHAKLPDALAWRAQLQRANLVGADLRGAQLGDANLEGADLRYGRLQRADLENGQLQGANLRGANLEGADLTGAQLQGAILADAQFQGVQPDGSQAGRGAMHRRYGLAGWV